MHVFAMSHFSIRFLFRLSCVLPFSTMRAQNQGECAGRAAGMTYVACRGGGRMGRTCLFVSRALARLHFMHLLFG